MTVRTPPAQALLRCYRRTKPLLVLPLILAAVACSDPEGGSNGRSSTPREADQAPIGPIPDIAETRGYRCPGDLRLYVDYFRDGTGAILRTRDGIRTRLVATTIGGPFISQDQVLERSAGGIVLSRAGQVALACGAAS